MNTDEFIKVIWQMVKAEGSQKEFAKRFGISTAYLNDILHKRREPGDKLLNAIGVRKEVTYHYHPLLVD